MAARKAGKEAAATEPDEEPEKPTPEPAPAPEAAEEESDFARKREPGDTTKWYPDDWPQIEAMLKEGKSRREIAGDYGVSIEQLNAFINRNRSGQPKGE
jgi:hypothetical protein